MLKIIKKLFKHKHKWKSAMNENLYAEGWEEFYVCKCGAIKKRHMLDR